MIIIYCRKSFRPKLVYKASALVERMLGNIDRDRLQRAFDYLSRLDSGRSSGCYSVNLNSFLQLQLSRVQRGSYHMAVCRRADMCLIAYLSVVDDDREVVSSLEKDIRQKGESPKCGVCTGVASEGKYCDLCSIMQTRVEEMCAICLEEERVEAVWCKTACGHFFHADCLARVENSACPMCRQVMGQNKII
jgi:hypothetical protein